MRNEVVTYTCDYCNRKANGSKLQIQAPPAPPSAVRPAGWGQLHLMGQYPHDPSERHRTKADYCSEECLVALVDDFILEVYGEQKETAA